MWTFFLNTTNWLVAAAAVAALWAGPRALDLPVRRSRRARRSVLALLAALALLAGGPVTARLVLGYSAPGAYAEEVVAARLLLERRSLGGNEVEAFREWTSAETISHEWLAGGLSACQAGAADARAQFFTTQGHPPFLLVASIPIVAAGGGRGLFLTISVLGLGLLAVAAVRLLRALHPGARPWQCALAVVAAAGWQPVLAALRQGDAVLIASALLVLGWTAVQRTRPLPAGLAIGAAGSLSIGAALAIPALALRSRSTALVAAITFAAGLAAAAGVGGSDLFLDVTHAGRLAALAYAPAAFNYSLLGRLLAGSFPAQVLTAGLTCAVVVAWTRSLPRSTGAPSRESGADVDLLPLACCTAVLASPVAWSQHLALMLLPAAVILANCLERGSRAGLLGWCTLVLVLAMPDPAVTWTHEVVGALPGGDTLRAVPLPLAAVVVLTAWTAARLRQALGRAIDPSFERQTAWIGGSQAGKP